MQAEVFFIHHNGEQRGPYTARQVNHLHRCGFIDEYTLYWREGLEQWQPVSEIILRRRKRNRRLLWLILAGIVALAALFGSLFGPVTADAWRELTSGDFTEESAWWRARGLVNERLAKGDSVAFDPFSGAQVTLHNHDGATVTLGGTLRHRHTRNEHAAWRVRLRYDADRGMWLAAQKQSSPPATP